MGKYYNPQKSEKYLYNKSRHDPKFADSPEPFRLSRTKIDLFVECPRCFYLDQKLGVGRPPGYPFNLNNAVDELLKREFDGYRAEGKPHPLMKKFGIDAIPFKDERMDEWRDALRRGVQYTIPKYNLTIRGGIDDVWINKEGELNIVDYKATSKKSEVTLDAEWQDGYKRQMEVYQWLFRRNGFKVSNTGYFVYVNAKTDANGFNDILLFDSKIIPYAGDDSWVYETIENMHECLTSDNVPKAGGECDFCAYRESAGRNLLLNKRRNGKLSSEKENVKNGENAPNKLF